MSQNQQNQDPNDINQLTSLQWNWAERNIEKFDALPARLLGGLGAQRANIVGLVGLLAMVVFAGVLVVKPLHSLAFGAPRVYTPETAVHGLPGSRLARLHNTKKPGLSGLVVHTSKGIGLYIGTYFLPNLFSAKLKNPDLLILLFRALLFGCAILLCLRFVFAQDPEEEAKA